MLAWLFGANCHQGPLKNLEQNINVELLQGVKDNGIHTVQKRKGCNKIKSTS